MRAITSMLVLVGVFSVLWCTSPPCFAQASPAAASSKVERVQIPPDLAEKLRALPQRKIDFITSGVTRAFMPPGAMFQLFRTRTPADIEVIVDVMLAAIDEMEYRVGRDAAAIPLDTQAESFNAWKTKRPPALNPRREPGPISLTRYMGRSGNGISTFAGAPLALTVEDLKAGKVDIAIVGVPLDMGMGYRGAKGGPMALRTHRGARGNDMHTMINPTEELSVVDYGDIAVDDMSAWRSMEHIRTMLREIVETGALPFVVGGDHSVAYAGVAALTDVYGKGNVGVVHLDAHYDAAHGEEAEAHLISHAQPVYRLINDGYVPGKNYIQVGLRGTWPGPEAFHWMREQGFRYHTMAEVESKGWNAVMDAAVKEAREGPKHLYVSFDVDVIDPAFVPGTGTPAPGGLTMREAVPIVRRLCAESNVVGFEIVEINPLLDPSYRTALNSNAILHACMTGVALRRKGIKQEQYLSPLSVHDGEHDN